MTDVGQVLGTGGTALVSAAAGAGLAYWLGALNRRHQEEREDRTRWYDARFKAYSDFSEAVLQGFYDAKVNKEEALQRVLRTWSWARLVSSPEVDRECAKLIDIAVALRDGRNVTEDDLRTAYSWFLVFARKDLGHPAHSRKASGSVENS